MTTDPRILQLAQTRHRIAHEAYGVTPDWNGFNPVEKTLFVEEAAVWLRAAVEAGIAPLADRPTDKHMAVYLDEENFLYGEYDGDDILRLVWVSEQAESKREMEERGAEFRLIGWSE